MAGVEQNPGPQFRPAKDCKGLDGRVRVCEELRNQSLQEPEVNQVRDKKVFCVNRGPKEEMWSLEDFEVEFTHGRAWGKMQENVWTIPTMNLPDLLPNDKNPDGRVAPDETINDLEKYLMKEFQEHKKHILNNMPDKERRKREKNSTKIEDYLNSEAMGKIRKASLGLNLTVVKDDSKKSRGF